MINKKFLVVDDSKIAREKITSFLVDLDVKTVHHAKDGLDALNKFSKINYDFIIMDLEMPNMKGNEASKRILSLNPNVNIILVTSIIDKKELIIALQIGVKKLLKKPVSFKEFQLVLNDLNKIERIRI